MIGEMAMCWMFFLYIPNSAWPQSSVLLAYEGTNGLPGFELGISSSGTLMASFYDMDGTKFALTSSVSLEPSKWLFIGINFNMLWKDNQFDFFLIDHELTHPIVTKDTHSLGPTDTLRLNAHGSIILGADHVDQKHFVGKMACIQFYRTSIVGGTQKEAVGLCDPNMWSHADYGEYTIDASSETTTQRTTTRRESTTTTLSTTTTQPKTTFTTPKTLTTISTRQPNHSQQQTTAQLNPTGCSTDDICRCVDIELNEEELADKIESLKEKLLVNKETTSMMIRTKTCAEDERASAKVIGQCGLAVLIIVTGFLVLQDVVTVLRTLFSLFRQIFHTISQVNTVAEGTIKTEHAQV